MEHKLSPWTTKVHSQVCLRPERHISCTGSVSSTGFWWRWCQAPDVPTETGAHRLCCPSGRRLRPRQTYYWGWSWWNTTNLGYILSFRFLRRKKKTCHPPRLFGDVRRDQDHQASGRPMMPQTPGHHYGAHAVRVCGDQGDKGFPGLTSGGRAGLDRFIINW